jgi:hypothetical protein
VTTRDTPLGAQAPISTWTSSFNTPKTISIPESNNYNVFNLYFASDGVVKIGNQNATIN